MAAEVKAGGVLGHQDDSIVTEPIHGGALQRRNDGLRLDRVVGQQAVGGFGFGSVPEHGWNRGSWPLGEAGDDVPGPPVAALVAKVQCPEIFVTPRSGA